MSNVRYVRMADERHAAQVLGMMTAFYAELEEVPGLDPALFPETIRYFLRHPEEGRIVLLFEGETLAGYAIIVRFWSNEYGGMLLLLDELYVAAKHRRQGIARGFFAWLKQERPWQARAMMLEVARSNPRGQELYKSVGFKEKGNMLMSLGFRRDDQPETG